MLGLMTYYIFRNGDDEVHVQNMVGAQFGQHHIHTAAEYREWADETPVQQLREMKFKCDCGHTSGTYIGWPLKGK